MKYFEPNIFVVVSELGLYWSIGYAWGNFLNRVWTWKIQAVAEANNSTSMRVVATNDINHYFKMIRSPNCIPRCFWRKGINYELLS